MRNNSKNHSLLTADFGGVHSDINSSGIRPIDYEKSLTQEDYNHLNYYVNIKNNFHNSYKHIKTENANKSRSKKSSNFEFRKSINDESFSSFDRKISDNNGEMNSNNNQHDRKLILQPDARFDEGMSHSDSRFLTSKGQDTYKSTEGLDKK